jgi:ABC-type antimicrobial peptide transport system permease subunit
VDRELFNYTLRRAGRDTLPPDELWLRLAPGTDSARFIENLRQSDDAPLFDDIRSVQATLNSYETDVLSAGVVGLLFLSFVVGLLLSVVSLFTYISLSMQARLSEFAVLRAIGLSGSRLTLSIMVEQGLVLLSAIVLGGIIGQFLTLQVLPPLALSAAGGEVTPPFVLRMDWVAIVWYLLLITGVLLFVLLISAYRIRQTADVNALRLTEE